MKRFLFQITFLLCVFSFINAQYCDTTNYKAPEQYDTYFEFEQDQPNWQHFNVHDPTVYKDGEWYYMYNTDVGMGYDPGTGALKRRSKDLVYWEFLGQAFNGIPDSAREFFLQYNPSYTDDGIWAPYLTKYKNEYRLYYSAPGGLNNTVLAFIGLETSSSANGPWEDKGEVTSAIPGDTINAIDPTVVIDSATGKHWMAYGSYQTGIYMVELDSTTGKIKTPGDRGIRIAGRSGGRHAAIEGAELTYRNGWYYLFVSYDWLEDQYNVRVGRSQNAEGPYYDIYGTNMANYSDNYPMILAPYKFRDHVGWQGTGHCAVYNDSGQYYMFHQARPADAIYNMVLHTRKMFWINDWPVVSPERYAAVPQCPVIRDSITGKWERMKLIYNSTLKTSTEINFESNGTINGNAGNTWTLDDSLLIIHWNSGSTDSVIVYYGYDWEYRCRTLLFTGLNTDNRAIWGKKLNQLAIDKYTKIVPGAVYQIRNHYSNMLIGIPEDKDLVGASILQDTNKNDKTQAWRILETDDGYYKLSPLASADQKVMQVNNGSSTNGAYIKLSENDGTDKTKFKIVYNNNGYYQILTKVSGEQSCLDLYGFSIVPGGVIAQWTDLDGLNQMWRIMQIDTIAIDTTDNYVQPNSNNPDTYFSDVNIYPNPSNDGYITVGFKDNTYEKIRVAIYTNNGILVHQADITRNNASLNFKLNPGIYFVHTESISGQKVKKLIIF